MLWSPQQETALKRVGEWLHDPSQQVFYLAGFAGTGKTTLAREFAAGVEGQIDFMSYTGKAAYVMRQKGCPDATTIHSRIYISRDKSKAKLREMEESLAEMLYELHSESNGDPTFDPEEMPKVQKLREEIRIEENALKAPMFVLNPDSTLRNSKLAVVDEISMVDEPLGRDLLSFGVKVLVLGDPFQLPPVYGCGYFTNREPDFQLTEIHRQAEDNPILWMAAQVRQGKSLNLGNYGESSVVKAVDLEDVIAADQILVGKNETRKDSNVKLRKLKLFKDKPYQTMPVTGDRLVCLRNDHEVGLLNGAIYFVVEAGTPTPDSTIGLHLHPEDEGGKPIFVTSHTHYFEKRGEKLPWYHKKDAQEFDYGGALTVHKAQGSQWDNVLLFDESYVFRENRHRHLYTGLTRAAKRVKIVRM